MSNQLLITLAVLLVIGFIVWSVVAQWRRRHSQEQAVERLGLSPCPEKKGWLENIVIGIENNRGYRGTRCGIQSGCPARLRRTTT